MPSPNKVAIIIGSIRDSRIGPKVVSFLQKAIEPVKPEGVEISTVDLKEFKLPVWDEDAPPRSLKSTDELKYDHSKKWSKALAVFDGFILVSPEYNYGVPGSVKNSLDYLYSEITAKPFMIVTYGIQGGATASNALKDTLTGMSTKLVETRPQLKFEGADIYPTMAGILGDATVAAWEKDETDTVVKGFKELVAGLDEASLPVADVK